MANEPSIHEATPLSVQQQVDQLADELLARGIRPTPKALAAQVDAPKHRLAAALEDWASRLSHSEQADISPAPRGGIDFIAGVPRERRENIMSRAAQAAGQEAARRKSDAQQLIRQNDLRVEIDRAQARLERLEERSQGGDTAPHIEGELQKTRDRLSRMKKALSPSASPEEGADGTESRAN